MSKHSPYARHREAPENAELDKLPNRGRMRSWLLTGTVIAALLLPATAGAQNLNVPNNTTVDETANFTYNNVTIGLDATLNIGDPPNLVTIQANGVTTIGSGGFLRVLEDGTYIANSTTNILGGTLQIDAGGTYDANATINGSVNGDTVIVDGVLDVNAPLFGFAFGDDTLEVSGTLDANLSIGPVIEMSNGDDTVIFTSDGALSINIPGIDAGVALETNGDRLVLQGNTDFALAGLETFTNFEHLTKHGNNTWTLTADNVTGASFEDIQITGGELILIGTWNVTGNLGGTAVSIFGSRLQIGDSASTATFNQTDAAGTVAVGGLLLIENMATATFGGPTNVLASAFVTVADGGILNTADLIVDGTLVVNNGGQLAAGPLFVQDAGLGAVEGVMTATTTTVRGGLTIGSTGDYQSSGMTSVMGSGVLSVSGGSYAGGSFVQLSDSAQIIMTSGSFSAQQGVAALDTANIDIRGGTFTANSTTSLSGNSTLQVLGGNYVANAIIIIGDGARLIVDDQFVPNGVVFANSSTSLTGGATLVVSGGAYNATGAIQLSNTAFLIVNDNGTVSAMNSTDLNNASVLVVRDNGVYQAAGTITVFGGTVTGDGSITGSQLLNNIGGIVSPGLSAGTLSLVGTYQQGAGARFVAEIQPGGPSDLLAVTGPASLGGQIQVLTLAPGFAGLEQIRVISTTAPIPTIFDTASLLGVGSGDLVVWVGRVDNAGTPDLTGNNVDVIIVPALSSLGGLTPNQQAVADYLGGGFPGGTIVIEDDLVFSLAQIIVGGPNALDQIGGEVYDSFTTFAFDTARQYGRLVDRRVRTLRCAAASGATSPLCGGGTLLADTGPDAIATPGAQSPLGFSPNTHPYGWSIWAAGLGSYLSKDRTTEHLGYNGWTTGAVMGVDLALSRRWIVGVMFGGSWSDINFSGVSGDGDLSNVGIGVYTAWYGARWFADASFTYAKNWIEADRNLQFGTVDETANGNTTGDQYAAHATVGYGFGFRRIALEVSGGIDWVQLRQNGFTETGADTLNLTVNSRTDDSLRLRIGVRAARPFAIRPGLMLVPTLKLGYARELLDNTRPITSSLGGIPGTFTVTGDDGSRNILTFGAGVKAEWSQGITASLSYDGEWAGDRQIHGVTGRIHIRW